MVGLATLVPAALLMLGASACATMAGAASLTDKTLVVWVAPANHAERGGSALTLIDPAERFDAIVLGEAAEAKWMAGSDFFRRTCRDQSAWPMETARPGTLVQVAIVYRGSTITLVREGREIASYPVDRPQPFGDDAMVLVGLRYVGAMGEIGFLTGEVADARIYAQPLDLQQISALRPNAPSVPAPLAWWSFADGRTDDRMGRFPVSRLLGGAVVRGGRLVLDGGGYLWAAREASMIKDFEAPGGPAAPFDRTVQGLFYKPRSPRTGNMWDTWLTMEGGTWYLYYLANARGQWDNVSMATSPDGLHWTEIGPILTKRRGVTWMGTGSVWRSARFARDHRWIMNYSEWRRARQTIFFAASSDLVHWDRLGDRFEFVQDERWYEREGRWDCIWTLPRPGGGYYGYWTATPRPDTGGRFGFGESLDGVTWRALAPPRVEGVGYGEVGAIQKVGERYYMMFGTDSRMVTLVADRPDGPFRLDTGNVPLLAGHTYFSRFVPIRGGLLVDHHSIARDGQVSMGTLKRAFTDQKGTLWLRWWKQNDRLKRAPVPVPRSGRRPARTGVEMLPVRLDPAAGLILEGTVRIPAEGSQPPVGLWLGRSHQSGSAVLVRARGAVEFGAMNADGTGFSADLAQARAWPFGATARFRLVARGSLVEFYLDDVLVECYSLPTAWDGRLGIVQGGAPGSVSRLRAWSCGP